MTRGRTRAVVNAHEIVTGDFTQQPRLPPSDRPADARRSAARLGEEGLRASTRLGLAEKLLGDAIYSNMLHARRGLAGWAGAAVARRRS